MAILEQERHIEYISGLREDFVITSRMVSATAPAQAPHTSVFVYKIVTRTDPKDDTLVRVARISDLLELPMGRNAGLDSSPVVNVEYLTNTCTLKYKGLTEALLGATTIRDRVNKLLQDWATYYTEFNAAAPTPALYTLPTGDAAQKEVLIAAFRVAKQACYTKQTALTEAGAVLLRAQADYTYKHGMATTMGVTLTAASAVGTYTTNARGQLNALRDAGDTFFAAAAGADAAERTLFQNALNVADNAATLQLGYAVSAADLASRLTAFHADRTAERETAATLLATTQAAQILRQQEVTAALAAEATALAAVMAICPDFVAANVCSVAG